MPETAFQAHTMSVRELAQQYFPSITPKSAATALREWIFSDQLLMQQLSENGFEKSKRVLSPKQVALIVERLGNP
jgi:hypothetical protein